MLKPIQAACLALMLCASQGMAQTTQTKTASEPVRIPTVAELPNSFQFLKRGNDANAVRRLAGIMLKVDPEGNINAETLAVYESILIAQGRARAMQGLISMDLNFDGQLTADERAAVLSRMDSQMKLGVVMVLSGADANEDGVISAQEMRDTVRMSEMIDQRSERELQQARDLMMLDFNQDGVLTLSEMTESIRAILNQ